MPTQNPRINVTLPPSLDVLVERMADFTHVSKSQVLRELLVAAEPSLQRAVALMEAATVATRAVNTDLSDGLRRAQDQAQRSLGPILAQLDAATADLVFEAEAIRGKRSGKRSDPLSSNRGVKTGKQAVAKGKPRGRSAL